MDLAIRNGTLIDGTGRARYRGDLGIAGGRLIAVGDVPGRADEEIDAAGAIVAPGFIDVHTHYDAQVLWDPMVSPSVYHGVTTVLAGNCGFTLAPLSGKPADTDYLLAMLSRVEGMPLPALLAGVKPTWRSFGEYLDTIDGKTAINTAFLVGHSTLRRHVMGERAVGHEATDEEVKAMAALLRRSLAEGGAGFSTTVSLTHSDHNGDPVPSRWATTEEMLTLAAVCSEFPGTWVELVPTAGTFSEREYELTTRLSLAAQRPVNWNVMVVSTDRTEQVERQLETYHYAAARGAKVYGLTPTVAIKVIVNFRTGFNLDVYEGWAKFLALPDGEKLRALADPAVRQSLKDGIARTDPKHYVHQMFGDFSACTIEDLRSAKNARWKGKQVGEYAAATGLSPIDALLKLALEEELSLSISAMKMGDDAESWAMRGRVWRDAGMIVGGSDAGAHLDMLNSFALTTQMFGEGVRKHGLLSLEEAVHLMTAVPAERFGLIGRGVLAAGAAADVVIFDPETVACGPIEMRNDLPLGEPRLYAEAVGIKQVIVNGIPVAANNRPSGRLGGRVLRSGRDTATVPLQ